MTSFAQARDLLLAHRTDHAAAVGAFRWPDVAGFNWACDWFDAVLASQAESADRDALVIVGEDGTEDRITFRQMARQSNQVAQYLALLGVRHGDRMLVMLGNDMALWEIMLAAMKLGAVVVPATPMLTSDELLDRVRRGRVALVVTSAEDAPKFDALRELEFTRVATGAAPFGWHGYADARNCSDAPPAAPRPMSSDPFLLYFTSGTTAQPKLVMHSQASYPVGALSTMFWLGLQPGDVHLNISSPGWAKHAWSSLFAPWNAGATIVVFNQVRFSARRLLDLLASHKITTFCAPPTVWRMVVQEDLGVRPPALREACSAGEPLNAEIIAQVQDAWGVPIRDGYGQTETTAMVGNTPGDAIEPGVMGLPLPGYRLSVRDADGDPVDEGEVCVEIEDGEIEGGRPLGLMGGYLAEDASLEGCEGPFYRTGDVAFRAPDGRFTFVGRADDVFKSSDYRISPFELESALIEHPAIVEAAVVPAPDPVRLSIPKAYVILADGVPDTDATAAAIFSHLKARLAPYKRIRRIEFVDALPKTTTGKIRRVQLRRQEMVSAQASTRRVREFWESEMPVSSIRENQTGNHRIGRV